MTVVCAIQWLNAGVLWDCTDCGMNPADWLEAVIDFYPDLHGYVYSFKELRLLSVNEKLNVMHHGSQTENSVCYTFTLQALCDVVQIMNYEMIL